jgi:hypothetical protein
MTSNLYRFDESSPSPLLTLYARKELTTDPESIKYGFSSRYDVALYRDAECTVKAGRFNWFASNRPRHNSTRVTLNCYQFNLEWV